jgi:DNA repair exonuclease SbcCD ATPase subunit
METLNTLNFISKAKKIDINPKMNCQTNKGIENQKQISQLLEKIKDLEMLNQDLTQENENLKTKINNSGHQKIDKMTKEKKSLLNKINHLKTKISEMEKESRQREFAYEKKIKKMSQIIKKYKEKNLIDRIYCITSSYNYIQPLYLREKEKTQRIVSLSKTKRDDIKETDNINSNNSIDFRKCYCFPILIYQIRNS